jgi:hypothetical protein
MKKLLGVLLLIVILINTNAQGYNATNGSAFAGVLGNFINPASAINSATKWDYSVIGGQSNTSNSGVSLANVTISNLLSNQKNIIVQPTSGYGSRSLDNDADMYLLNFRINLDNKQSFSYGIRIRSVTRISSSPFRYSDTTNGIISFLNYNSSSSPVSGYFYNEDWLENDFSYSGIISEKDESRFTGGVTVALLRGIFATYLSVDSVRYITQATQNVLTGGSANAMYSSNSYSLNPLGFGGGKIHLGLSFGLEYLEKKNIFDEPYSPKDYYWKLSASVMDIGANGFTTDKASFHVNTPSPNVTTVTDVGLRKAIGTTTDPTPLKKIIVGYFKNSEPVSPSYQMSLPTRFVVNLDKSIDENIYINALASFNFYSKNVSNINNIKTTEIDRFIVTSRWENDKWGFFVPIQYTIKNELLLGIAIKYGPFLVGYHNISWFQRTKIEKLDGGGYVALHFQPRLKKLHHSLDCYYE